MSGATSRTRYLPVLLDLVSLAADLIPIRDTQAVFRRALPLSVAGMLREKLDHDVDVVKDCCQRDHPEAARLESAADAAFSVVAMCRSMLRDLEIKDRLFETRLADVETTVKQFWEKAVRDVKNALVLGRPVEVQTCVDAFEVTVRSFHDRVRTHVGSAAVALTFELPLLDDAKKEFALQLMELFDVAKRDDATVQTLLDEADNLAVLQRVVFPDARVPLAVAPAASFAEWVRERIEKLAAGISFRDPHTRTSRSAAMVALESRRLHTLGVLQPFLDAHCISLGEKSVKTHTDAARSRLESELKAEKTALMRELNSVAVGVGGSGCGERLSTFREFLSCRELQEELDRPYLYREFYSDITNAQSIDEPLEEIDDESRLTNLLNVCAVYAKTGDQTMEERVKVKRQEITAAVNKQARHSRDTIVGLVREVVGRLSCVMTNVM